MMFYFHFFGLIEVGKVFEQALISDGSKLLQDEFVIYASGREWNRNRSNHYQEFLIFCFDRCSFENLNKSIQKIFPDSIIKILDGNNNLHPHVTDKFRFRIQK